MSKDEWAYSPVHACRTARETSSSSRGYTDLLPWDLCSDRGVFEGLPHLFVDDWANVTPALLRERIDAHHTEGLLWQNRTLARLSKSYWLNLVRSSGV